MKWIIPAKTFLLGEYAAIEHQPAILLTTSPCFEITLTNTHGLQGIHSESPAGRFWLANHSNEQGLHCYDPYGGQGGMGASSAQFLGAYYAHHYLQKNTDSSLLNAYWQYAWQGEGVRPSGYDILSQSQNTCVYIEGWPHQTHTYSWPFADLAFVLLHTGQKLATHHHLQALTLSNNIKSLTNIVQKGKLAFELQQSHLLIEAVKDYHLQLMQMNLVASHSLQSIQTLQQYPEVLAIKGCGAMGADVLCVLTHPNHLEKIKHYAEKINLTFLATQQTLYKGFSEQVC